MTALRVLALALGWTLVACSFVLPASWRAFRVEPEDAAPVITRSLDERSLTVANWDRERNEITTDWVVFNDALEQTRERYRVRWEKNHNEQTLTVFVRHEAEDREQVDGAPSWGQTYHDATKEGRLLDEISRQLVLAYGAD